MKPNGGHSETKMTSFFPHCPMINTFVKCFEWSPSIYIMHNLGQIWLVSLIAPGRTYSSSKHKTHSSNSTKSQGRWAADVWPVGCDTEDKGLRCGVCVYMWKRHGQNFSAGKKMKGLEGLPSFPPFSCSLMNLQSFGINKLLMSAAPSLFSLLSLPDLCVPTTWYDRMT